MFRRFCLLLLILGLAIPAIAAPLHCGLAPVTPPTTTAISMDRDHHHGGRQAPVQQAPIHDCIGCIAPFTPLPGLTAFEPPTDSRQKPHGESHHARLTSGPDTPPPRA
jgi:hypothetical protein